MYAAATSACGTYSNYSETQTCQSSGSFNGSYTSASPLAATTRTRYAALTSSCGTYSSTSETQTCQSSGSFNGSYTLTSAPSASARTMYASASPCGGSCSNESQTCQSGGWSGTYASASCSVVTPTAWYRDSDSDSYGNVSVISYDCSQPSGYVNDDNDCNDSSAAIYPGTTQSQSCTVTNACSNTCTGSQSNTCQASGAYSSWGACGGCTPASCVTAPTAPTSSITPATVVTTDVGRPQSSLTWTGTASGYMVVRYSSKDGYQYVGSNLAQASFTDVALKCPGTYTYYIYAYNTDAYSSSDPSCSVTPLSSAGVNISNKKCSTAVTVTRKIDYCNQGFFGN